MAISAKALKTLKVYDNGGETADRYSVWMRNYPDGGWDVLGLSADPFWPQGFNQFGGNYPKPSHGPKDKLVKFASLPKDVQKAIRQRFNGY